MNRITLALKAGQTYRVKNVLDRKEPLPYFRFMSDDRNDKLKTILSRLKERGASAARMTDVSDIVVDERVRLKCQVPLCESYRKNLMCPPFVSAVSEFRDALRLYSSAVLIQVSAELKESPATLTEEVLLPAKKLHELVHFGEREAFAMGFRFAAGFIGGCCRLCSECAAIDGSTKCRFPFKARPSMEAMGIDVIATVEKAGLQTAFPITDQVTWTGMILL